MTDRARFTGLSHTLAAFLAVIAATSATLAALNTLPEWLGNNPYQVRAASSVSAAESRLGQGLWLPAYYPQWLAYPPASVRYVVGPPSIVAIDLRARGQAVRRRARSTTSSTWCCEADPGGRGRFSWTSISQSGESPSTAATSSTRT